MPHDIATAVQLLQDANHRLVRTVDGFADDDWSRPTGLPGWTRAHVVAHLALNSEGLGGALGDVVAGSPASMYASQEGRDGDIAKLAEAEPEELRARFLAGVTDFDDAVAGVPEDRWGTVIERTPGSERTFVAAAAPGMRLREVEIHHADLQAGYSHHAWPTAFSALVLDAMGKRGAAREPFTADPSDLDGTWEFGQGGPTVSGTAADLAWWLTGRGAGEGLTSDNGTLPGIEEW